MDLHERFKEAHRFPHAGSDAETPKEYYIRCLVSSLYTVGRVSNTPSPIPLPNWDDDADLFNILGALHDLSMDILEMLKEHQP